MFEARFQTFDDASEGAQSAERVAALRAELKRRGLTGFLVPRADRQQNEYLPASEERLAWLTGFTGSAGAAIVLAERAALFVDGRYTVQVKSQADTAVFTIEHFVDNPPAVWLENNVTAGDRIGFDPWLHTADGAERFARACAKAGATLVAVDDNPIDALWQNRPAPPDGPVRLRPAALAGESAADKLARIQGELAKLRADALIVSDPQNVNRVIPDEEASTAVNNALVNDQPVALTGTTGRAAEDPSATATPTPTATETAAPPTSPASPTGTGTPAPTNSSGAVELPSNVTGQTAAQQTCTKGNN